MNDIYSLFMAEDEPTAQDLAQALGGDARRERGLGLLGQLSGDRVLSGVGNSLFAGSHKAEDRMARAGEARLGLGLAKAKAQGDKAKMLSDKAEGLRKELHGAQVFKDTQTLAAEYQKVQHMLDSPNAVGDMGIVFTIMKMFDPTSSVKEGEQAQASNAGGVPVWIRNTWNNLLDGKKIEATREQFRDAIDNLMASQIQRLQPYNAEFGRLAREGGVAESDVVLDYGFDTLVKKRKTADPDAGAELPRVTKLKSNQRVDKLGRVLEMGANGVKKVVGKWVDSAVEEVE